MERAEQAAIRATGIVKRFGETVALDGLDLEVARGSVLGLLGPNGSGKTTLVRILTTLTLPDAGSASVLGHDVIKEAAAVRRRIGLAGQFSAVEDHLTGYENLEMAGRLYHLDRDLAAARARQLLERFGLDEAADRQAKGYSGGMKRRLDLAASLVAEPSVLFLDEPTTGLDPRSRIDLWEVIRALVRDGTTLLLTTQYLEEADQLADSIVVIDHGRVIAKGTPEQLKDRVGGDLVTCRVAREDLEAARSALEPLASGGAQVDPLTDELRVAVGSKGSSALLEAVRRLDAAHVAVSDLALSRPSLDDVFLALTGHAAVDESTGAAKRGRRSRSERAAATAGGDQKEGR